MLIYDIISAIKESENMNHFSFELALVAVLPAIALCAYVFFKDRAEKEPIGLLAVLFGAGALAYIPSVFVERLFLNLIDKGFESSRVISPEGLITFESTESEVLYLVLCAFFGFSLVRICFQWLCLFLITYKNKNFNYLFDGVVYSVFLSLGFAVAENVHFIMQNDIELLLPKLLTSVACQLFVGIVIGYYYTMWHMRFNANKIENVLKEKKLVENDNIKSSAPWLCAGIVIPFLTSAVYALAGSLHNEIIEIVFYTAVFTVFGISFLTVDQMASKDGSYGKYLYKIIAKGHPELSPETIKNALAEEAESKKEDAE